MENLLIFHQIKKSDILSVGGKGASLGEMAQAGIPVPPGFAITTQVYKDFNGKPMSPDVEREILSAFDALGAERVAVRSSAVAEDSPRTSWAGQLESYLNVTRDNLIQNIEACWKSIESERALEYAAQQNIEKDRLLVAVVIQKMVDSEASGVIFSINPVTKNENELMIEAGYGLGEMLVQGMITPDNFVIDKNTLEILSENISTKETMLIYEGGTTKEVEVPEDKKSQPVLTDNQVGELAKLAISIEQHYVAPQDIEWAMEKNKFYIVQSRPITTL